MSSIILRNRLIRIVCSCTVKDCMHFPTIYAVIWLNGKMEIMRANCLITFSWHLIVWGSRPVESIIFGSSREMHFFSPEINRFEMISYQLTSKRHDSKILSWSSHQLLESASDLKRRIGKVIVPAYRSLIETRLSLQVTHFKCALRVEARVLVTVEGFALLV